LKRFTLESFLPMVSDEAFRFCTRLFEYSSILMTLVMFNFLPDTALSCVFLNLNQLFGSWIRDYIYTQCENVSEKKRNAYRNVKPALIRRSVEIMLIYNASLFFLHWQGILTKEPLTISSLLYHYMVHVVLLNLTNIFGFHIMHSFMHDGYIRGHEIHHELKEDTTQLAIMYFSYVDFVAEAGAGFVLIVPLMLLFGMPVKFHMASIYFNNLFNFCQHSANPYSVAWGIPFLDDLMYPAVAHPLHHTVPEVNPGIIPFHHLFTAQRKQDIDKYNEVMGTNFRAFGLFESMLKVE
jgi:hypothetical protein